MKTKNKSKTSSDQNYRCITCVFVPTYQVVVAGSVVHICCVELPAAWEDPEKMYPKCIKERPCRVFIRVYI